MNTGEAIRGSSVVAANRNAVACELEGAAVILNLDTGIYFGLNPVGAEIWKYIQAEHSLEDLTEHLTSLYRVDRERCETEVAALLRDMEAQSLIKIHTNEDAA